MSNRLYSVEQVADHLSLHVRTVRNYIRDGRLDAVRIGKQYRITHEALEAFTGHPVTPAHDTPRARGQAEVSAIVEIDAVDPATADRLTTPLSAFLTAAAADRRPGEEPLRIETAYNRDKARLKIIILGSPGDTARLLAYIDEVLTS
ncbi:excisionase family DNA binding protein [Nocardiopsis mwathae]|uniref:Excisionase family DNA binding protein n=1 Tax=Nocardiopsis mwathae TaxID=1472723 RepID=A0A7W9YGE4_9ACTN|nr:excisionase family DNA binding protein [Nocardiopsis mwathae]